MEKPLPPRTPSGVDRKHLPIEAGKTALASSEIRQLFGSGRAIRLLDSLPREASDGWPALLVLYWRRAGCRSTAGASSYPMNAETRSLSPSDGRQLTLVAFLRAKPGRGDELGRRLLALSEPARADAGNINYDLHRSDDDADTWMLYENWSTAADLDAHFAMLCGRLFRRSMRFSTVRWTCGAFQ